MAGISRADLLALARLESAAPTHKTFQVRNNTLSTREVSFSDSVQTVFLQFRFTAASIVSVCDTCTASVTVTPAPGAFGFTLGPPGLVLRTSSPPVVTIHYGRYADFSVHDSSTRYSDAAAFEQALQIWRERAPEHWAPVRGSGPAGTDRVEAPLVAAGAYLLAAPR